MAFTTTKVPRFDGTTSWEQYQQVFDAIVRSNGWDNDTVRRVSKPSPDLIYPAYVIGDADKISETTRTEIGLGST